jgi:protein TonB
MFDSVLLLDRTHASRFARAELATLVVGAHAAALAAILAAQSWRIEAAPLPGLPVAPLERALPVVFADDSPAPARARPPRAPERPAVAQPAPAPVAATPEQLAAAEVPELPAVPSVLVGAGAPDGAVGRDAGDGATPSGDGGGDGATIHYEGSGLTRPTILVRVDPVYPALARHQRKSGRVLLRAEISADGLVRGAEVIEAAPTGYGFEQSALDAVRQWRFRPAKTRDGIPAAVLYRLEVTFTLH